MISTAHINEDQSAPGWYTAEEAGHILGISARAARDRLNKGLTRKRGGRGRPTILYHHTNDSRLTEYHLAEIADGQEASTPVREILTPDRLAVAMLRAQAVHQYMDLREHYCEDSAANMVVADWTRHPRTRKVKIDERIRHHKRKHTDVVEVGGFCKSTLREWASIYKDRKLPVEALAPSHARSGRRRNTIPESLLDLVHALAVKNPRADIAKALAKARDLWTGEWPEVSYDTWRRRIRERDPERFCDALGKSGTSRFMNEHTPDVNRDYLSMSFNEEYTIDDVSLDFYTQADDPNRIFRPYAYAIMRLSTRQWVCAVTTETPITQDQVRSLVGLALSSPAGGIPNVFRFEGGTVALDSYLEELLQTLGITTRRTGMDGGATFPGAVPDRNIGRGRAKAVQERGHREIHGLMWDQRGQVGGEERHTKHQRHDNLMAIARERAKSGEFVFRPANEQWQTVVFQALESYNTKPHGGLPEIVDPETGAFRHMTPNEMAMHKKQDAIEIMPETYLPLFFEKGYLVPVTSNGFRLNDNWYGRFDQDVQSYAGNKVTAYAMPEHPDVAYVVELGRCVEAYRIGQEDYGKKMRITRTKRNQYEQMILRAMQSGGAITAETVAFTVNPTPDRPRNLRESDPLANRCATMERGKNRFTDRARESAARFDLDTASAAAPRARRGILAQSDLLAEQARTHGHGGRCGGHIVLDAFNQEETPCTK